MNSGVSYGRSNLTLLSSSYRFASVDLMICKTGSRAVSHRQGKGDGAPAVLDRESVSKEKAHEQRSSSVSISTSTIPPVSVHVADC